MIFKTAVSLILAVYALFFISYNVQGNTFIVEPTVKFECYDNFEFATIDEESYVKIDEDGKPVKC